MRFVWHKTVCSGHVRWVTVGSFISEHDVSHCKVVSVRIEATRAMNDARGKFFGTLSILDCRCFVQENINYGRSAYWVPMLAVESWRFLCMCKPESYIFSLHSVLMWRLSYVTYHVTPLRVCVRTWRILQTLHDSSWSHCWVPNRHVRTVDVSSKQVTLHVGSQNNAWNEDFPEKLRVTQLVKKFPALYGTRKFITAFKRAHCRSLSRARWLQSTPSHPFFLRSILMLSFHLPLNLRIVLLL